MKNGRPQAKDIPDVVILKIVHRRSYEIYGGWHPYHCPHWVMRWEIAEDLEKMGVVSNAKVVHAKLNNLIHRGLLDGCTCGCRGDFELTLAGRTLLNHQN